LIFCWPCVSIYLS